ncbi:MAG: hypothetical protein H6Q57_1377 [Geobacteraceae bacterium]|jgi:hypothetical protein|nr:hypothetical protein [Geobacteraceae bacterium]
MKAHNGKAMKREETDQRIASNLSIEMIRYCTSPLVDRNNRAEIKSLMLVRKTGTEISRFTNKRITVIFQYRLAGIWPKPVCAQLEALKSGRSLSGLLEESFTIYIAIYNEKQ